MGNLGFIMGGGGNLYATGFDTSDGNVNLTVHAGATLFLGTVRAVGNVDLRMDHINFQGGAGSVFGTGNLLIQADGATQYVEVDAPFAQTVYERTDTLEIGITGFEAFFTQFQSIVIGNATAENFTYVFYDTEDALSNNSEISGTTITFTYLETANNTPPTEFQLASLYDTLITTLASHGQLTEDDIQGIIDDLGLTGDFSAASFDDSSDSEGDFFFSDADSAPASDEAVAEFAPAADRSPAALAPVAVHDQAAAVEEDSSWIDRAVIVTAATAVATKPLRRFAGLF